MVAGREWAGRGARRPCFDFLCSIMQLSLFLVNGPFMIL